MPAVIFLRLFRVKIFILYLLILKQVTWSASTICQMLNILEI